MLYVRRTGIQLVCTFGSINDNEKLLKSKNFSWVISGEVKRAVMISTSRRYSLQTVILLLLAGNGFFAIAWYYVGVLSYQPQKFGLEQNKSHEKKSSIAKKGKNFRWTPHFTFGKISVSGCKIMANGMWDGTNCHHIADGPFGRALGTLMNEMGVTRVVDLGWTGMDLITLVGHFLTILFKQLVSRSHPLPGQAHEGLGSPRMNHLS